MMTSGSSGGIPGEMDVFGKAIHLLTWYVVGISFDYEGLLASPLFHACSIGLSNLSASSPIMGQDPRMIKRGKH